MSKPLRVPDFARMGMVLSSIIEKSENGSVLIYAAAGTSKEASNSHEWRIQVRHDGKQYIHTANWQHGREYALLLALDRTQRFLLREQQKDSAEIQDPG